MYLPIVFNNNSRDEASDKRAQVLDEVEQRHGAQIARRLTSEVEQSGSEYCHTDAKVPKNQAVNECQRYLVLGGGKILGNKVFEGPDVAASSVGDVLHVADAHG